MSVLWGLSLLMKGIRRCIGTGEDTLAFSHLWIPRERSFKPITRCLPNVVNLRVCDLMTDNGKWDVDKMS